MMMTETKLVLVYIFAVLAIFALTCNATTYTVGDTSGWDISTDLASWVIAKNFQVGDVLVFQYSSSQSVDEVTRDDFNTCNTTNVVQTFSNGNTTIPLSNPGERYFISGNKLYCLSGMKLRVNVEGNQTASAAPVGSPQGLPGARKSHNSSDADPTSNIIPTSNGAMRRSSDLCSIFVFLMYSMVTTIFL